MPLKEIRILLVDDDVQMGKAMYRALVQSGIHAHLLHSSVEAKAVIEKHVIDLLVTDYLMPQINGLDLLKILKQHQPNALGVLVTGMNDFSLAVSAINEGSIYHFITKPFENAQLVEAVQKGIDHIVEMRRFEQFKAWRFDLEKQGKGDAVFDIIHQNAVEGLVNLLQAKDAALYAHSKRISDLCGRLGRYLGFSEERIQNLMAGALLHDIGKLAIKDQILDKPDKLDANEYKDMKRHPQVGADLLEKLGVNSRIVACVHQHHERVDGLGYPLGLACDQIAAEAKIVAIADAYDALRSERAYKAGFDLAKTKEIMYGLADSIYDKKLLDSFYEMLVASM